MLEGIKARVQERMMKKCAAAYETEVVRQQDRYTQWMLGNEDSASDRGGRKRGLSVGRVLYQDCCSGFSLAGLAGCRYVVFSEGNGTVAKWAVDLILDRMEAEPGILVSYGNEDCYEGSGGRKQRGKRVEPWFKPDWSPDTLLSFFYFGAVFVVRTEAFLEVPWMGDGDYRKNLYDFVLKAVEKLGDGGVYHLEAVLFHHFGLPQTKLPWGAEPEFDGVKGLALDRRGIRGGFQTQVFDEESGEQSSVVLLEPQGNPLVSIIIPSKDNAEVLGKCLLSIQENTLYSRYEIIVVDNGSSGGTKIKLEMVKRSCPFRYVYRHMDFNFSLMCNLGAEEAKGTFLLFMNDDIVIPKEAGWGKLDWLGRLVGQAALAHCGAVGVKLLYPGESGQAADAELIQHAGVTNLGVGPAHKLGGMTDRAVYYHGQNRLVYDMIAVTAACLMVERKKYAQVKGFCQELCVAYNDVEFCMKLYEHGYHNVQRNDISLLHYESLSRGDDRADEVKWIRLMAEKDKLYELHPGFAGYDPYYSRALVPDSPEYFCNYRYEYERRDCVMTPMPEEEDPMQWENGCVQPTLEYCGSDSQISNRKNTVYLIEGWVYILGVDNARYARHLVLRDEEGHFFRLSLLERYRKDVAEILPDQLHVELAGFVCRIEGTALKQGNYSMILCMKDKCSRQCLSAQLEGILRVENGAAGEI